MSVKFYCLGNPSPLSISFKIATAVGRFGLTSHVKFRTRLTSLNSIMSKRCFDCFNLRALFSLCRIIIKASSNFLAVAGDENKSFPTQSHAYKLNRLTIFYSSFSVTRLIPRRVSRKGENLLVFLTLSSLKLYSLFIIGCQVRAMFPCKLSFGIALTQHG